MTKTFLTIVLIAGLGLGCAFGAPPPDAASRNAPIASPQVVPPAQDLSLAENLIAEERQEHREQMFLDRWMIGLTCVLGFIALLQLLAFAAQAVYMRKTFASARDTARRNLRAYVDFADALVQHLGDGRFQVQIAVTNSGRTRALTVIKWMKTALLDSSQNCVFDEGKFDRIQRAVAPQSRWHLREDHAWPQDVAAAIERREKTVHVWGQVRYTDIYGEPHLSNFRFRSQATNYSNGTITGWALEPHEEGNDLT